MSLLASIPSPGSGTLDLGPFQVHLYGVTLLLAIASAVAITGRRWVARGGDWELIYRLALWGVAAGIVGARVYHVLTSWSEVPDEWWGVFAIWKGGLGVWGGIAAGCVVGGIVAKRAGADVWLLADCLAPGLLVAQGVGRIGNWWNQELFGRPTDLPWGLEIDPSSRPLRYLDSPTFHPTFLYELVWDLAAAALLVYVIERRLRPRSPGVFAAYIALYCFGRFWIEALRIDTAHHVLGLRLNDWVALGGFLAGVTWYALSQRGGTRGGPRLRRRLRRGGQPPKRPAMTVPRSRVRPGG